MPRTLGAAGSNNEGAESWPDSGQPYSAAPEAANAGEQITQGIASGTRFRKVRIRGRAIPIQDVDRVKFVATGEVYNVVAPPIRDYDANETIVSLQSIPGQPSQK